MYSTESAFLRVYSAFKNLWPAPKFGQFLRFLELIFRPKNDFSKLPHKTSRRGSRKVNFKKSFFCRQFYSKNLENDKIKVVGHKLLNAL